MPHLYQKLNFSSGSFQRFLEEFGQSWSNTFYDEQLQKAASENISLTSQNFQTLFFEKSRRTINSKQT